MSLLKSIKTSGLVFALAFLSICNIVHARESAYTYVHEDYVFNPTTNPMANVDMALESAKQDKKLLLVVLGAQWCHDSKGLAGRFSTPEMKPVLAQYETVFVDVGYLEDRRQITQRFGYPIYFATPTVMIINPQTESLVNGSTMDKWAFADSVSLDDYVSYFTNFANASYQSDMKESEDSAKAQLRDFAYQQAQRLQDAYSQLGPMLEEDEKGNTPEGFIDMWVETRKFRLKVQKDLIELQQQAMSGDLSLPLSLPEYPPFSWASK
jgi:hypothetical protein